MGVRDKFRACERVVPLEEGLLLRQLVEIVCVILDVTVGGNEEACRNVSTILRQPSVEFKLGCLAFSAVD